MSHKFTTDQHMKVAADITVRNKTPHRIDRHPKLQEILRNYDKAYSYHLKRPGHHKLSLGSELLPFVNWRIAHARTRLECSLVCRLEFTQISSSVMRCSAAICYQPYVILCACVLQDFCQGFCSYRSLHIVYSLCQTLSRHVKLFPEPAP